MKAGEMRKWIVRIVLGVAAVMMVGAVSSYLFIDRELTRMYGGLTEVADPALSKESMDSYAIFHVNVLAPEGDRFLPDDQGRGNPIRWRFDDSSQRHPLACRARHVSRAGFYRLARPSLGKRE